MINELLNRIRKLEEMVYNSPIETARALASERRNESRDIQPEDLLGLHIAICVDTFDPLKRGRIRIYTPMLFDPTTPKEALPWASPISAFGGFDDSGMIAVPPAGSRVAIMFHGGNRPSPYYLGTIWEAHRGSDSPDDNVDGSHLDYWGYPVSEYECLWQGKRNGYLVGKNNGDQSLPPWNTESYNGYDLDSTANFYDNPSEFAKIAPANISGFKSVGKHSLKWVDGDPTCNNRYKRVELNSACGNFIHMKDDHLHPSSQYAFGAMSDLSFCHAGSSQIPQEWPCCSPRSNQDGCTTPGTPAGPNDSIPSQCKGADGLGSDCSTLNGFTDPSVNRETLFANPFFKRQEEMRPHLGAPTPMGNRLELPQSGIQMQTIAGHRWVGDDSVDQPTGVPTWDRNFDFGCNDIFKGRTYWQSATGHKIELSDIEDERKNRGPDNGIFFETANGISMSMGDHSIRTGDDCSFPPNFAGSGRGFFVETTAMNRFEMSDSGVRQGAEPRKDGGIPTLEGETGYEGYVLLRSGYGLQLLMKDQSIQTETDQQFIQLLSPQVSNTVRGPHMFVMQESPEGPGLVMLRAGGAYYVITYDDSIEVVGDDSTEDPATKFVSVKNNYIVDVKDYYFHHNTTTIFASDQYILLLAGKDCPPPEDPDDAAQDAINTSNEQIATVVGGGSVSREGSPCIVPAIGANDPWVCPAFGFVHYGVMLNADGETIVDSRSKRVFITSGGEDEAPPATTQTDDFGTAGGNPPDGVSGEPPVDPTTQEEISEAING